MVDHEGVNNVNGFSPEIQLGLGYQFNEQATVTLGYQMIIGQNPKLTLEPLTETGVLHYIPMQQAVMLGVSFVFH